MIKKFVLTAFVALIASIVALAQNRPAAQPETAPANKTERMENAKSTKDADKIGRAEERSNGSAYSGKGKGKGGKKDRVEKGEKGEKGKGKGKTKGKFKNKNKSKDKSEGKRGRDAGDDDNKGRQQGERKRDQERTGGEKAPTSKPAPAPTEQKSRKAGDKPTPGTENRKGK